MFISENGLNLIKEFEGCILQSYDDYNERIVDAGEGWNGTLTIGWGHIEDCYAGQRISQQEADDMLKNDMVKYCNQVDEVINEGTISFPVNQNMYDAMVSFDYNCGQGSLRSLCNGRDKQTVADMLLEYRNKGSQWEAGLLRRRQAERSLFLSDAEGGVVIQGGGSQDPISRAREFVGDRCGELQQLLINKGYDCGGCGVDNQFGQGTYNSLIQFQNDNGLNPDGLAGDLTFAKLNENPQPQPAPQPIVNSDTRVLELQRLCNSVIGAGIAEDNCWGGQTENAVSNLPLCGIPYTQPELTKWIQARLGCDVDGIFLYGTEDALKGWQCSHGLQCDGVCGFNSYRSLALD